MRYDVLRNLACRAGGEPQRLNAYIAFDQTRAESSSEYAQKAFTFHSILRDFGYRVSVKKTMRYTDDAGEVTLKSNTDLDMAVDVLTEAGKLDTVLLVTGDGDFVQVVRALQNKGCRVEVLAFNNVSRELRDNADLFINGYLIPGLVLPRTSATVTPGNKPPAWGEVGSRVRGVCVKFDYDGNYGFINYYRSMPSCQIIGSASEIATAFFKVEDLENSALIRKFPSRSLVLEFDLAPSDRAEEKRVTARRISEFYRLDGD